MQFLKCATCSPEVSRSERVVFSIKAPDNRVIHEVIRIAPHRPERDDREQLAVVTLLLSAAGSDGRYRSSEIREAYDILERRFKLSPIQIHRSIERIAFLFSARGRRRLTKNALLFLKMGRKKALHRELFKMVTRVVRADGRIARGEVGWLKQFVRALSLTASDCRNALQPT